MTLEAGPGGEPGLCPLLAGAKGGVCGKIGRFEGDPGCHFDGDRDSCFAGNLAFGLGINDCFDDCDDIVKAIKRSFRERSVNKP